MEIIVPASDDVLLDTAVAKTLEKVKNIVVHAMRTMPCIKLAVCLEAVFSVSTY